MIKAEENILHRMLGSGDQPFSPDVARFFLNLSFSDSDRDRIEMLSAKANEDSLNAAEREELTTFVLLSDFLAIAHSKARQALQSQTPAA